MQQRYSQAARLCAPKLAAVTAGLAVEGYWLDDEHYFFLAERFESSLGRIVTTPSVADAETQRIEEVISLENLAVLLTEHAGRHIDLRAMSSAGFEMPDRDTLAVSVAGCEFLIDVRERRVRTARSSLEAPALYSPDGRYACVVKGHDLYLNELGAQTQRPLTRDGAANFCYGQESESNLAALSYRRCPYPLGLWSPDSQWLLTHRIDERHLPDLPLLQHVPRGGGRPILHRYKYPFPGDPMPMATYVAIHVASGRTVIFDECPVEVLAYSPFSSFYRLAWFGGAVTAWCVGIDRYSRQARLFRLDLEQGTARVVLEETVSAGYVELHQSMIGKANVRVLTSTDEVVWFSERDGWGHLYLYDSATGALKNRITRGEWLVRDLVHVDESERKVLFTACGIDPRVDPARRSLCAVNLDGGGFEVLFHHDGDIAVPRTDPAGLAQTRPFRPFAAQPGVSPGGRFAAVHYGSAVRGNITQIVDLHARHAFSIASVGPNADDVSAREITALAADGVTRVHGIMFLPSHFDESQRYPIVDYIYPGPHVTHQPQCFGSMRALFARAMAELGFIVIMLDVRGMPFRSRAIHQMSYGDILGPQLADHAAVVRQLCERHRFVDGNRVGMIGYSAGGAATARALFDYGEIFKVGVAVCGNHDDRYNTAMWSDKYRGPGDAPSRAQYANGERAHKLRGRLLLISGDMDENVHVAQTLALVDSLVRANRDFDLLIVPNEGHDVLMTSGYTQRRVWDYFVRHLLGEQPPADFQIDFEPHELACWEQRFAWELELWR